MPDSELPEGWRIARLGDLVLVNPDAWEPSPNGTIRYLDIASITAPGKIGPLVEIPSATAPSRARRKARPGDVLVSTVRPYLKAFARLSDVPDDLVISTGFAVLRPREAADGEFVYQQVLTEDFQRHVGPRMTGTGYPAVRPKDVADFPILVPPAEERARIATVLDAIDAVIERTEAVIAATERLRSALLHELLTRGVPGWHTEWKDVPGIGTIPACWDVVRLGDVVTLQRGIDLPVQERLAGSVPVYGSNGVAGYHQRAAVRGPGVVVGRSGSVGSVRYVEEDFWPLNTTLYVRDFHGNHPLFAALLLGHLRLGQFAASTGVPSLNRNFVHPRLVGIPPPAEQERIVKIVSAVDERLETESGSVNRLLGVKDAAAAALLSGRVRVPGAVGEATS